MNPKNAQTRPGTVRYPRVYACTYRPSLWDSLWGRDGEAESYWANAKDAKDHCERLQSVGISCSVQGHDLHTRKSYYDRLARCID